MNQSSAKAPNFDERLCSRLNPASSDAISLTPTGGNPLDIMFPLCSNEPWNTASSVAMDDEGPRKCSIEHVGKQRNGKPRFWCSVHQSSATGRYGARLPVCEGAYLDQSKTHKILELDPSDYCGGIALWGAVDAVYDTTDLKAERGIHVHARGQTDASKEIDDTFDAVAIHSKRDLLDSQRVVVTAETAVNFYLSRFLKREIRFLRCTFCDEVHLDSGYFAIKPHRRHLCHGCGRYFNDTGKAVSNPLASLHAALELTGQSIKPVRAPEVLDVRQADYPGGMQIWASNPALVWTSERPEHEGLHVHLFRGHDAIVVDETFDRVTVDGIELNESQVQHFMAQQALPHLTNKVVSLRCPRCDLPHFDEGEIGFFPHTNHKCTQCSHEFSATGRLRLVVSNPFVAVRELLQEHAVTS